MLSFLQDRLPVHSMSEPALRAVGSTTMVTVVDAGAIIEATAELAEVGSPDAGEESPSGTQFSCYSAGAAHALKRGRYKKDREAPRKGAFLSADEAVQAAAAEGLDLQVSSLCRVCWVALEPVVGVVGACTRHSRALVCGRRVGMRPRQPSAPNHT